MNQDEKERIEDLLAAADFVTCVGGVRGECGHKHKTVTGAIRCIEADRRACRRLGGYSDRTIRAADGVRSLDGEEPDLKSVLVEWKGGVVASCGMSDGCRCECLIWDLDLCQIR